MIQTPGPAAEISKQGFTIIKKFISNHQKDSALQAHIQNANKFSDGVIKDIPEELMTEIREGIKKIIPSIATELNLSTSANDFAYCAIRIEKSSPETILRKPFNLHQDPKISAGGVLNWHLDHYSFYLYKDHINWLICYIPIFKPDPSLANLAIIPQNLVKELDPDLYQKITGRGAMRFRCAETDTLEWFTQRFPDLEVNIGDWFAIDDFDDASPGFKIKFDLEAYKSVPELEPYDLLIMRADVIHRTHDAGSDRISVRCDAMPLNALNLSSWTGLFRMTLQYPFMGAKRKYNIRRWLMNEWQMRLAKFKRSA